MWLVLVRKPPEDLPVWAGRRLLAALDAAFWPLFVVGITWWTGAMSSVMGGPVVLIATVVMVRRLIQALDCNERYRFTSWLLLRVVAGLLIIGVVHHLLVAGLGLSR